MRCLITGGAGFIGSHLADALLDRGDHVTIVDDLSTGSLRNVAHLDGHDRFQQVLGRMQDEVPLEELVDDADVIFHLAAAVGVQLIVESPVRTIETNIRCTELVLELAARNRTKVFLASTSEVYGKSADIPFREDADLVLGATSRGRWSYACSKAVDEFLAIAYWRERRVPTVIGRLFNTVGPRQTGRYGMVVPRFVQRALLGAPLPVFGDGTQRRCFTHVDDSVRAILALTDTNRTVGEVYNIGSHNEVTIRELADRVIEACESASTVEYIPYDVAYEENFEDMSRRVPALEKIDRAVGWSPSLDLDEILHSVIGHERQEIMSVPVTA